jgi:hypothetical protein
MSEVKVNKISPRTNCGTVQLGDSGDTITIPAGATITNNGTQTGFGRTGTVDWDTTAKTAGFTAVSGNGYFVNTTSGAVTVTLPATPSAGDIVALSDYAGTAATNNITIARNGSNINGSATDLTISKNNSGITLVYVDGTQGWKATETSNLNDIELQPEYIVATGGCISTCGDYKTHIFTGPGTLCVSSVGNPFGSTTVEYMVVGGGGGASFGGGGAGGFRQNYPSPIAAGLPVTVQGYPITVGAGGSGRPSSANGNNSIFSSITSHGGGYGGGQASNVGTGNTGGSGGGGGHNSGGGGSGDAGGAGNTPPVSPAQGFAGGSGYQNGCFYGGGGGGGATAVGSNAGAFGPPNNTGGDGGAGTYWPDSVIGPLAPSYGTPGPVGSTRYFAGGGGGAYRYPGGGGQPGVGGGGQAQQPPSDNATAGTANTGGGGGGGNGNGKAGGSGIVMIRYRYQ